MSAYTVSGPHYKLHALMHKASEMGLAFNKVHTCELARPFEKFDLFVCTECDSFFTINIQGLDGPDYCPACGSRVRREDDERGDS